MVLVHCSRPKWSGRSFIGKNELTHISPLHKGFDRAISDYRAGLDLGSSLAGQFCTNVRQLRSHLHWLMEFFGYAPLSLRSYPYTSSQPPLKKSFPLRIGGSPHERRSTHSRLCVEREQALQASRFATAMVGFIPKEHFKRDIEQFSILIQQFPNVTCTAWDVVVKGHPECLALGSSGNDEYADLARV